ncbi:MAG: response regulator transcription factor [Lachnospiraceae bacterium]|nr:response regulator transcription factor [Lachnospiraceae bacterium]
MIKILIVDDEKPICDLIDMNLSAAGYSCTAVQDGLAAIDAVENNTFDLVLLDIMLPGADGYDVMDYIKPYKVPVIFISAKHEVRDRVKGLKLGADDYLIKPFDVTELLARVEAVLRRYNKAEKKLTVGEIEIDIEARRVTRSGNPVPLTSKEFDLLMLFAENINVALFRENLYEKVWDDEYYANSRTLDLHVQRLRKKLGWEKNLVAVYKVGYRLEISSANSKNRAACN